MIRRRCRISIPFAISTAAPALRTVPKNTVAYIRQQRGRPESKPGICHPSRTAQTKPPRAAGAWPPQKRSTHSGRRIPPQSPDPFLTPFRVPTHTRSSFRPSRLRGTERSLPKVRQAANITAASEHGFFSADGQRIARHANRRTRRDAPEAPGEAKGGLSPPTIAPL